MKKLIYILILLMCYKTSLASIVTVKQDGSGDYTSIQSAVNSYPDTVVVYPGTYFENVLIDNYYVIIGSLTLTTGDASYRETTIIDGQQNGSCVSFLYNSQNYNKVELNGFTIQNGSGKVYGYADWAEGGGIYIGKNRNANILNCIIKDNNCTQGGGGIFTYFNCKIIIDNCIIVNNIAKSGGGVFVGGYGTVVTLKGSSVYKNHSTFVGGGISFAVQSTIKFDSINRCSIYGNYSAWGTDITVFNENFTNIYLDTATVLNPGCHYIYPYDYNGNYTPDSVVLNIQNSWLEPVNNDLYVNPSTGNNNNSGISPDDALNTIAYAYLKIAEDSINPKTIYLSDGFYSDSTNAEKFPLNMRSFVNLKGQTMNNTILDGGWETMLIKGKNEISDYKLSNMTLQHGQKPFYQDNFTIFHSLMMLYWQGENIVLDSMTFREGWSVNGNYIAGTWSKGIKITNCSFLDNIGGNNTFGNRFSGDTVLIQNCIFKGHRKDTLNPEPFKGDSKALMLGGSGDNAASIAINCLFEDNEQIAFAALFGGLHAGTHHDNFIVNCTFSNNSYLEGSPLMWIDATSNYFYNCIIYDNYNSSIGEGNIWLSDGEHLNKTYLSMENSLLEFGEDAIDIISNTGCSYDYDEHINIDEDPIFTYLEDHPYQIDFGSPCINTGTLGKLPAFINLPETDLAGNPRVDGDSIDMGAYEWNPTVGISKYKPINEQKNKLLNAAPNPFSNQTKISIVFNSKLSKRVEIYNNLGNKIKTLFTANMQSGKVELVWSGNDDTGKYLPRGIYYIVLFYGDKEVESLKIIKN